VPKKLDPKVAEKVMLKAGLQPLEPYLSSEQPWKCKCLVCGNVVKPPYKQIKRGIGGCRTCRYIKSGKSNSNSEVEAVALMLKNNLKPLEPYKNKDKPWKSICLICKKTVSPLFGNIKRGQAGCKWCARKFLDPNEALAVMIKQGYEPLTEYINDRVGWKSRCKKCQRISYPTYQKVSRQKKITGCTYCNTHFVSDKFARKVMRESGFKPLVPYTNARKPWKSQCIKCKNIVTPMYMNVCKGRGCNFCSPLGINLNIPSYLYLITHDQLNSHKVGIGNVRPIKRSIEDRLNRFSKQGWKIYKVWNFETGGEAWKMESAVFKVIRKDLGLPIHLSKEQMLKTEGHTETVNADSITLLQLEKIINKVIKGHRKYSHSPSSLLT
jgi:hypothetical protein